jgi:hypothetical protein
VHVTLHVLALHRRCERDDEIVRRAAPREAASERHETEPGRRLHGEALFGAVARVLRGGGQDDAPLALGREWLHWLELDDPAEAIAERITIPASGVLEVIRVVVSDGTLLVRSQGDPSRRASALAQLHASVAREPTEVDRSAEERAYFPVGGQRAGGVRILAANRLGQQPRSRNAEGKAIWPRESAAVDRAERGVDDDDELGARGQRLVRDKPDRDRIAPGDVSLDGRLDPEDPLRLDGPVESTGHRTVERHRDDVARASRVARSVSEDREGAVLRLEWRSGETERN